MKIKTVNTHAVTQKIPGVLNFQSTHTLVKGTVGHKDSTSDVVFPYVSEKTAGSDVGHMVMIDDQSYMIKIGITLSLLGQAFNKLREGNAEKARQYLSYIVGNFTRIAGASTTAFPQLCKALLVVPNNDKDFAKALTEELFAGLSAFQMSDEGKSLVTKLAKEPFCANDIYSLYHFLVSHQPNLKDVICLPAFADVVNGAYGQFFNNTYQSRCIPQIFLDDHRLLIESNDNPALYMASRFIHQAKPFDAFLLEPFLTIDPSQSDNQDQWLAACKAKLHSSINNLHGLCSAILIRHIMGEGGDLGPDNMLIVKKDDAQFLINIDVTGFRYKRQSPFEDNWKKETRLGWEDTLKTTGKEALIERLFNRTVFCNRFIESSNKFSKELKALVMKSIVEVLVEKVATYVEDEVNDVKQWLTSQHSDGVVRSLESGMELAYQSLDPKLKPSRLYYEKLVHYNKDFISESIAIAKQLARENLQEVKLEPK